MNHVPEVQLTTDAVETADVVITMGRGDTCPVFPGKRYLDWQLPDPAGKTLDEIRPIRDQINHRVQTLLADLTSTTHANEPARRIQLPPCGASTPG